MFYAKCPLGTTCSKGGASFHKSELRQEVVDKIRSHLLHSPYHGLSEDETNRVMDDWEIEGYLVEGGVPPPPLPRGKGRSRGDVRGGDHRREGRGRGDERGGRERDPGDDSRSRSPARRPQPPREAPGGKGELARYGSESFELQRWSSAASGSLGRRAHESVTLSRAELQACVESLQRAHRAADGARMLCSKVIVGSFIGTQIKTFHNLNNAITIQWNTKATRAFAEEAQVIQSCADTIAAYIQ